MTCPCPSDNDVGLVTTSSDKFQMKPLVDDDDDDCDGKSVGSADTDSDLDDSGSDSTVYRDAGEICLLAWEQGQPPTAEGMDAYGYSFEDLSEEDQRESRLKAIGDYNEHNAWEEGGLTNEAMRALQKRDKNVVALRSKWVDKAKCIDGIIAGKSRLTPKGYEDHLRNSDDNQAPTIDGMTLRALEIMGLREGWVGYSMDFSQAFFQTSKLLTRPIYVEIPDEFVVDGIKWKKLTKAVPGTNQAPRAWYDSISVWLLGEGFIKSRLDPALFYYPASPDSESDCLWSGYVPLHVDDAKGRGTAEFLEWFRGRVDKNFGGDWKIGEFSILENEKPTDFCGKQNMDVTGADGNTVGMRINQTKYVEKKLVHTDVHLAGDELLSSFRTSLGTSMWATVNSQFQEAYSVALGAQKTSKLTLDDAVQMNKAITRIKDDPLTMHIPVLEKRFPIKIVGICDAGMSDQSTWEGGQEGRIVGLSEEGSSEIRSGTKLAVCHVKSGKFRRITSGSFAGESVAAHSTQGVMLKLRNLVEEFQYGVRLSYAERMWDEQANGISADTRHAIRLELYTDSKGVATCVHGAFNRSGIEGRRIEDLLDLRESIEFDNLNVIHIHGKSNPTDALTKCHTKCTVTKPLLRKLLETGTYIPDVSDVYTGTKIVKQPSGKKKKTK